MPAQTYAIGSSLNSGTQEIASMGDEVVGSVIISVTAASSLSTILAINVSGDGQDASPVNCQYINVATGVVSPAGTAITANGIYGVYAPGCNVWATTSAGTATIFVQRPAGRVF